MLPESTLVGAAIGAAPIGGNVGEGGAGVNVLFRQALGLFIDEIAASADEALRHGSGAQAQHLDVGDDVGARRFHIVAGCRVAGLALRDMYLLEVKKPEESKKPWGYLKIVETVSGDKAFRPLEDGGCPLVTAGAK
jgi:hypothetical protein